MGALEPLLLTPLALLGWATPTAAALVGIAVTASLAALSVALARRLGAPPWMAILLWAIPPAVVAHHHVALYGTFGAARGDASGSGRLHGSGALAASLASCCGPSRPPWRASR